MTDEAQLARSVASAHVLLRKLLDVRPGTTFLAVGCGRGPEARWLAEDVGTSGRVIAMDVALPALLASRSRLQNDLRQRTSFVVADAARGAVRSSSVDGIVAVLASHHVGHTYLREWGAYVPPGGHLGLIDWHQTAYDPTTGTVWTRIARHDLGRAGTAEPLLSVQLFERRRGC